MKLNREQQSKLISKLKGVWRNKKCDIFGQSTCMIDDTLFEIREFHGGKTIIGSGAIKPFITLNCSTCGNTKFINAIQIGIVDPKNPSMKKDDGEING